MKLDNNKRPSFTTGQHKIRIGFPLFVMQKMPDIDLAADADPVQRMTGYTYSAPVTFTIGDGKPKASSF